MLDGDPLEHMCRQAAHTVLSRHGWSLVDEGTLSAGAARMLSPQPAPTPAGAERACQRIYAETLYAAARDPARQATAYREIHAYLYRVAQHQRPALAEDAAQEAILLLYQGIDSCHDPAAFLKFAIYKLLTAFHRLTPRHPEPSLDALLDGGGEEEMPIDLPGASPDGQTLFEEGESAVELLRWLHAVIQSSPRARNQVMAVALKYLEGWDDTRIASALDTTVANVHVLRSRGLEKLRGAYLERAKVQDTRSEQTLRDRGVV